MSVSTSHNCALHNLCSSSSSSACLYHHGCLKGRPIYLSVAIHILHTSASLPGFYSVLRSWHGASPPRHTTDNGSSRYMALALAYRLLLMLLSYAAVCLLRSCIKRMLPSLLTMWNACKSSSPTEILSTRETNVSVLAYSCVLTGPTKALHTVLMCCSGGSPHELMHLTAPFSAHGRTVVHVAASLGALRCLKYLLEIQGVDLSVCDQENGWTALHRAIYYSQVSSFAVIRSKYWPWLTHGGAGG